MNGLKRVGRIKHVFCDNISSLIGETESFNGKGHTLTLRNRIKIDYM